MDLTIQSDKFGDVVFLEITGTLNQENGLAIAEAVRRCMSPGTRRFVIDLGQLQTTNAFGVRVLNTCIEELIEAGMRVRAVTGEDRLRQRLEAANQAPKLTVHATVQEAIEVETLAP